MTPWEQIGSNLARIRREKSLTQEQLRDRTDVSQQYLSKLESGLRNPTVTILLKIAAGLDVSLFALLEGLEKVRVPPRLAEKESDK